MAASTRLHWSVDDWVLPPTSSWPAGTEQIDEMAVQTPMDKNPIQITLSKDGAPSKMVFVLKVLVRCCAPAPRLAHSPSPSRSRCGSSR